MPFVLGWTPCPGAHTWGLADSPVGGMGTAPGRTPHLAFISYVSYLPCLRSPSIFYLTGYFWS